MLLLTFASRLRQASLEARACAQRLVVEPLPPALRYVLEDDVAAPLAPGEVVRRLWHEGRVPARVGVHVAAASPAHTLLALRCEGGLADEPHLAGGPPRLAPFAVTSPLVPPGWQSPEASGRFSLFWVERLWGRPL